MRIKGLVRDRQLLVKALSTELGEHAVYCGAPTFSYRIGAYTVLRDGSIESERTDDGLLSRLSAQGLIEIAPPEAEVITVSIPSAHALTNLIFMLAAKAPFINKAIGTSEVFSISNALVEELKMANPSTLGEVMEVLYRCGGDDAMRGLRVAGEHLVFTGFPPNAAYQVFAECLVKTASRIHYAKAKSAPVVNEKYTFRVWLNSLGMIGDEYKEARRVLLRNFNGNGSFRTEEQYKSHREKLRNRAAVEPDFVLL